MNRGSPRSHAEHGGSATLACAGTSREATTRMPRITATEMVGVAFTPEEVRRLLEVLAQGALGPTDTRENVLLRQKLEVLLQVVSATERRRAAQSKR